MLEQWKTSRILRVIRVTCVTDVNECDELRQRACGGVVSECVNTVGSFICRCRTGFQLDPDTQRCRGIYNEQNPSIGAK